MTWLDLFRMDNENIPLVSVVMTACKTEQSFFEEAVNSILGQTFSDFEFLLVDDGLGDENRAWLSSVLDERLHVLHNGENIGQSKSVNKALAIAKGKYVVRMDADDIALPTRVERQVAFMEDNPGLIAAGAQIRFLGTDKVRPRSFSCEGELRAVFALKNPLVHPTLIIRLEMLREWGIHYNETILYAQDYMLWVDLLEVGEVALQPEVVLLYRLHSGQVTKRKTGEQKVCADRARLKYLRMSGVEASLRDAELIGEVANGALSASRAEYDAACRLLARSCTCDNASFETRWMRRLVAAHVVRSVLVGLKSPGGFRRLAWPRFWRAILCVPYWPYYIKSLMC